jgi:hypothetical protein
VHAQTGGVWGRDVRIAALLVLTPVGLAHAVVLGGGSPDGDCRVAFGGVDASVAQSEVVCVDGDPACDTDGTADGACRFDVSLCTAVPVSGCTPVTIDAIAVTGLPLAPPPLPSSTEQCGPPNAVTVPVGGAAGGVVLARGNGSLRDVDYLNLCCQADGTTLAAARCALAVDLRIAGCTSIRVPAAARAAFERARRLVEHAAVDAARSAALQARATHALERVRQRGRRVAARDPCGYAIALIATVAVTSLAP